MPSSSGYSRPPAPRCKCKCDCHNGAGGQSPDEGGGHVDTPTGSPSASPPDMGQQGGGAYNLSLGQGLEYSTQGYGTGGGSYGNHWVNPHQPRLVRDGANRLLESGATDTVSFVRAGSGYVGEYYVRDVLKYDPATKRHVVTVPTGERKAFNGDGLIETMQDAYGSKATYSYINGELASMQVGSGSEAVGYEYSFDTLGRLEMVLLRVGGAEYRRINYRYTAEGNLERVTVEEKKGAEWKEVETSYYRYYPTGKKLLRFVIGDHAYKQIQSVNAAWPEWAADAELAGFADVEYGYQPDGKVNLCKTHGGKYTYHFNGAQLREEIGLVFRGLSLLSREGETRMRWRGRVRY